MGYDSIIKLHYFEIRLEREEEDLFQLEIDSEEKMYFSVPISKEGINDIINEIENYLKDSKKLITPNYLDQVQILEEDGKLSLECMINEIFIIIWFYNKDEAIKLSSELQKISNWNESVLEKTESPKPESKLHVVHGDGGESFRVINKKKRDALEPFISFFEPIPEEKIISEIIEFVKSQYSVEKLCSIYQQEIQTCEKKYMAKHGLPEDDEWYLPHNLRNKYYSITASVRRQMRDVIQQSQLQFSENLTREIYEFTKKSNKKKITLSDLNGYLFEKGIKISGTMKSVIHSNVNKKLML